ncbi:hypothetical protein B0H17DRAFT_1141294 [Mycena rosella]|uniref:Uncharacterized protein n=1 Tax=Mycena rosella TaxID=1033263 RepID=A0AAD7G6F2_MYCRO|nr:hypothetical protein B0H17DRAFT_1141294 [Mycena rosella]
MPGNDISGCGARSLEGFAGLVLRRRSVVGRAHLGRGTPGNLGRTASNLHAQGLPYLLLEKNLDACGGADILIIMMDTEEPHESLLQYPAEPGPILVVGAYWGAWNNCVPRNAILMADAVAPFVMNKANAELYPARLIDVTPVYRVFYKAVKNQWGIIPENEALVSGIVDESMETSYAELSSQKMFNLAQSQTELESDIATVHIGGE